MRWFKNFKEDKNPIFFFYSFYSLSPHVKKTLYELYPLTLIALSIFVWAKSI